MNGQILTELREMRGVVSELQSSVVDLQGSVKDLQGLVIDLGEAMQDFATSVDERFNAVDKNFKEMKATMVTKDYLDDRLGLHKGIFDQLLRKEDEKVDDVIGVLEKRKTISHVEARALLVKSPFPRLRRSA